MRILLAAVPLLPLLLPKASAAVPPFACFGDVPIARYDLPSVESDLSGVAVSQEDGHLWMVNNGDRRIYELELDPADVTRPPTLLNAFSVADQILDTEGISHVGGRTFLIADENPAAVFSCSFPLTDADPVACTEVSSGLPTPAGENLGFEGVTRLSDGSVYTVQEMNTPTVWSIDSATGVEVPVVADFRDMSPPIIVTSDITSTQASDDEVYVLAKLPAGIFRLDLSGDEPTVTDQYAGQICDMNQPEGVVFFEHGGGDYMMIVGEPIQVLIFEADPSCTLGLNATVGDAAACPVRENLNTGGCEKDLEAGGCEFSRCNKALTPHIKICTDTTPGVTDCSQDECMARCLDTLVATVGEAEGEACTHWAYDTAERECYIFAGCNDMAFDADYVQYILQDPTCEKTLADGGCEQRRCDKNTSNNVKICTDTIPGTTDCSLEECQEKCTGFANFTCSTFAYDELEKECYIFETCENEGDDEDYTTYVLVDPTCDNALTDGGCPNRRCSTLLNDNVKIFSGTDPASELTAKVAAGSVEKCQLECAMSIAMNCAYYAYDPVDFDWYLFETCIDEGFHDDYTTYVLGYGEKKEIIAANGGSGMCAGTLNGGGCEMQRCAKEQNAYNKICTDDSEETQCTLAECQDFCDEHEDFACNFFAYDTLESECYLFDNCIGQGEDADYTTYARTCGKSLLEGGCADRRCDKDLNRHEKICENGVSECTLEECETYCDNMEDWECSFFAYEAAESECYIFENCNGESDDEYILYARACSKTFEEGGCANRRCDKSLTAHVKTCTDDQAGVTDCSEDECKSFCDQNIGKDGEPLGFLCKWFAFEAAANECYLFEDCRNESLDEYVMYAADDFDTKLAASEPAPRESAGHTATSFASMAILALTVLIACAI